MGGWCGGGGGGGGGCAPFEQLFGIPNWIPSVDGDTYYIIMYHGLNSKYLDVTIYETPEDDIVTVHDVKFIDANSFKIVVTKHGVDARFTGRVRAESC
jgi:hypothetical protein